MRVVLDEAKAAGRLVEAVEAHDEAFDAAAFGEELVDLLFGCVEGEVADVEGCGVYEGFFEGGGVAARVARFVWVATAFFVLGGWVLGGLWEGSVWV